MHPRTNQIIGLVLTVPNPLVQMGKKNSTKIVMLGSVQCSVQKRVIGALHCDNADLYVNDNVYRYNPKVLAYVCIQEQIVELVLTALGISKFAKWAKLSVINFIS